jgi:phosphatidylserine synthase
MYCLLLNHKSIMAWNMVLSPIFLFCAYNPIIGVFHTNWWRYTYTSFLVLILVALYIYISGNFISEYSYRNTQELQRLSVLVFIFYFLLNLLCVVFKAILDLLEHIDD